jgi:glucosyl-3-phosphoglycerate synthase
VRKWFEQRTYGYAQFVDPAALAGRKRELGLSVSVLLTCFRETKAVRTSIGDIHDLNERPALSDQIALIAASSTHGLDAACPGVEVYCGGELMPEYGPVSGKGDAMWRMLSIARGYLVVYVNVEATAFEPHFFCGVLGPLLSFCRVRFAKAAYEYPFWGAQDEAKPEVDEALPELMARPLINLHYPELSGFLQPLSGEFAAPRELLCSIPFFTGQTTQMTIMVDILNKVGPDAMAQVNVGMRWGRKRFLGNLGCESYALLRAVDLRLGRGSSGPPPSEEAHPWVNGMPAAVDSYTRPVSSFEGVGFRKDTTEIAERPPMTRVLQDPTRAARIDCR